MSKQRRKKQDIFDEESLMQAAKLEHLLMKQMTSNQNVHATSCEIPHPQLNLQRLREVSSSIGVATESFASERNRDTFRIRNSATFSPAAFHGQIPPLETLGPTTFRVLAKDKVGSIDPSSCLFLKFLDVPPWRVDPHLASNAVAIDESGDILNVSFYNLVKPSQHPNQILRPNTHLAILQPYLKFGADGMPFIRCDNPDTVVFYPNHAEWFESKRRCQERSAISSKRTSPSEVAAIREQAKQAFAQTDYEKAKLLFERCIGLADCNELKCTLYSNLSQCNISLGNGHAALKAADSALALDPAHTKSLFRKTRALLLLSRPSQAAQILKGIEASLSQSELAGLQEDLSRIQRELRGEFDELSLRSECSESKNNALSYYHADFQSDAVFIDFTSRSARAIRHIPELSLIMVERAFCHKPEDTSKKTEKNLIEMPLVSIDPRTEIHAVGPDLLKQVVRRLTECTDEVRRNFFSLSNSPSAPPKLDQGEPWSAEHTNVVKEVLLQCRFQPAAPEIAQHFAVAEEISAMGAVAKSMSPSEFKEMVAEKARKKTHLSSGIWLRSSLLRHSCTPNATWYAIGDMLFLRSWRPIPAGTEITIPVLDPSKPFEERTLTLKGVKTVCHCIRCTTARERPRLAEIELEIEEARSKCFSLPGDQIDSIIPSKKRRALYKELLQYPMACRQPLAALLHLDVQAHLSRGDTAAAGALLTPENLTPEVLQSPIRRYKLLLAAANCMLAKGDLASAKSYLKQSLFSCIPFLSLPAKGIYSALVSKCNLDVPPISLEALRLLAIELDSEDIEDPRANLKKRKEKVRKPDELWIWVPYRCEVNECNVEEGLVKCSRCKLVYYCSAAHQKRDWDRHKIECRLLAEAGVNCTTFRAEEELSKHPIRCWRERVAHTEKHAACDLCEDSDRDLVVMPCCGSTLCAPASATDRESAVPSCSTEHARRTACAFHAEQGHSEADWRTCSQCRSRFSLEHQLDVYINGFNCTPVLDVPRGGWYSSQCFNCGERFYPTSDTRLIHSLGPKCPECSTV